MADVNLTVSPADLHMIIGALTVGADPTADSDPSRLAEYEILGMTVVEAVILRRRGAELQGQLLAAQARLLSGVHMVAGGPPDELPAAPLPTADAGG